MPSERHQVSVIMPSYNAGRTIAQSIQSVISQGYQNWELIIVDDKSTDNTCDIISHYAAEDPRIRPVFLEKNSGGPASPRNHGLKLARGRYIAFLDSDDLWLPTKLEVQISYMDNSASAFCCSSYNVIDHKGNKTGEHHPPVRAGYDDLLRRNTIGCLTVVFDAQQVGILSFPQIGHEDYALWLDVTHNGHVVHGIPEVLAIYRLSPGSVSSNKFRAVRFLWGIYHRHLKYSTWISSWYVLRFSALAARKYKTNR